MALLKSTGNKKVNLDFNKEFINTFTDKIENGNIEFINQTLNDLHEADVANLIENLNPDIGLGSIGELEKSMPLATFLEHTKTSLKVPAIRHSASEKDQIKKVAVLGGSGSFCINAAIAQGADALVTADLKYHDFYTPEKGLLLVDAGHYETEHFTKKIIQEFLTKKIPNFAFTLSEVNTNPVKYF